MQSTWAYTLLVHRCPCNVRMSYLDKATPALNLLGPIVTLATLKHLAAIRTLHHKTYSQQQTEADTSQKVRSH